MLVERVGPDWLDAVWVQPPSRQELDQPEPTGFTLQASSRRRPPTGGLRHHSNMEKLLTGVARLGMGVCARVYALTIALL